MQSFSELTVAMQWAIAGAALLLVFVTGRALVNALRPRRKTLYILDEARGVWENYADVARVERGQAVALMEPIGAKQPDAHTIDDSRPHEEADPVDREIAELSMTPEWPPVPTADWARDRKLCPCCDYPGLFSFGSVSACVLCDWDTPLSESPDGVVSRAEWERALADARLSYKATGSAVPATDLPFWMVPLTQEQKDLRDEARALFDSLRAGDRPDTSEVLEIVDRLLLRLKDWGEIDPRSSEDSG